MEGYDFLLVLFGQSTLFLIRFHLFFSRARRF